MSSYDKQTQFAEEVSKLLYQKRAKKIDKICLEAWTNTKKR